MRSGVSDRSRRREGSCRRGELRVAARATCHRDIVEAGAGEQRREFVVVIEAQASGHPTQTEAPHERFRSGGAGVDGQAALWRQHAMELGEDRRRVLENQKDVGHCRDGELAGRKRESLRFALDQREPTVGDRLSVSPRREVEHVQAVVDRPRVATVLEGELEEHAAAATDLDETVLVMQRKRLEYVLEALMVPSGLRVEALSEAT